MDLFKGYIKSKGKVPIDSIKDGNFLPEPPESGDYVGVLKEDIIQLDFDTEEDAKVIMKIVKDYKLRCDVLETSRGVHLYFINDGSVKSQSVGVFNAIGVTCDIGLGHKDRVVPIRTTKNEEVKKTVNGHEKIEIVEQTKERQWIQTYDELDVLPAFFRPISKKDYDLRKSSTRNQTLFNYILALQYNAFSKEEVRRTIKIINDYILYEPLSDREIDVITRDEAFSEEIFFEGKTFLHDRFGNYMLTNSNIMIIDGQMVIYTKDGMYSNNPDDFEKVMLDKIPKLKDAQRKEVYRYLQLKCTATGTYAHPNYLALGDSILDIKTMEEYPYSPKWIMNNRIPYNYNPDAYSEVMDRTLNKVACGQKDVRMLLEEMIGYSLYRGNTMQSAFILTGEGSNGKSTILNAIKRLLGKGNYVSLDLRELEERFPPAELYNKLANIGDDISAKYLDGSSVFKKAVTGESFQVEKKYGQPFELESYATQIFCANELPPVSDKTDGFMRRIVIVPFNARFKSTDPDYDPFIEEKLSSDEAMEYLLKIALEGLKRVLVRKKFTQTKSGEKEKVDYIKSNNNVLEWFEECMDLENESVQDVYMAYQVWCSRNGCHPVKKSNLGKEIKKELGLVAKPKWIEGKSVRVYQKEDE